MRARHAALSSLLLLFALAAACSRAPARPPLVLLISVDTLRRDALRAFDPGAEPLPHLDAFAAESARFERAASVASWTLPAHASMLTGVYPERHGATDRRVALAKEVPLLAERFRTGGFETIGITQGGYLDRRYGFDRGFDQYADGPARADSAADALHSIFDEAVSIVAARKDPRPLFLFLQTFSVHDYFALRPWAVEALGAKPPRTAHQYAGCLQGTERCDAEDWKLLRELYSIELRTLDAAFGRLRDALEAASLWEEAVVILTTDHGEGFDPARHRIHHGGRLHEDLLRIPLLVHGPGLVPRRIETPASLVDVVPTLLELAGLEPAADLDGRSLAGPLRSGADAGAPRALFGVEHYGAWWGNTRTKVESVQERPLAIAVIEGDRWYLRAGKSEAVYDVATDPHQERDLGASAADLPALRTLAEQRDVDRLPSPVLESSEELNARLRALGYAE